MTTDSTAQSTPTPAPVAVPEPTQAQIDAFQEAWHEADRAGRAGDRTRAGLRAAFATPREDAPRPEPVTAPLPNEAVRRLASEWTARAVYLESEHGDDPWWRGFTLRMRESVTELLAALPAADQRDEGTVREEIAREIEAERREHSGQAGTMEHLRAKASNDALSQAAHIARGGTR